MHPYELPQKGREHFRNAIKTDDHCGGMARVLEAIDSEKLQVWFWEDAAGESVLITEVAVQMDGSRELFIRMLAGSGAMKSYSEICDAMCERARHAGCSRVVAYVKKEILDKVFSEGGKLKTPVDFKEMYRVMGKEV